MTPRDMKRKRRFLGFLARKWDWIFQAPDHVTVVCCNHFSTPSNRAGMA
jgi:hypothetical protein